MRLDSTLLSWKMQFSIQPKVQTPVNSKVMYRVTCTISSK